jgi:hypothetical protein
MFRCIALLVLLLSISACQQPVAHSPSQAVAPESVPDSVRLRLDRTRYAPGATVNLGLDSLGRWEDLGGNRSPGQLDCWRIPAGCSDDT